MRTFHNRGEHARCLRSLSPIPPRPIRWSGLAIWLLRAQGQIGPDGFAAYAGEGLPFPQELFEKKRAVFASPEMETVNRWLMDVYYYYFPDLPAVANEDRPVWGAALLALMKEAGGNGTLRFEYETPALTEAALARKDWLARAVRPEGGLA
ncbi:hypothetical protein [Cohnella thermotolerans]|uniref:hypothetical protein n=1 Tax=Cohnella thermotolerans TaxID=329858 RepID=UPI0012ECA404|nr:hypothetical protein [Cohnella thermotolerans]